MKAVDNEGINQPSLENVKKNKEPIIVGYFPQVHPHYIVLDGNHRVMSRHTRHKRFIRCIKIIGGLQTLISFK